MPKDKGKHNGKKIIHPYSRKAKQIVKDDKHVQKVERRKQEKTMKLTSLAEKCIWFRDNIELQDGQVTNQSVLDVINRYLERFDDELEQIEIASNIKGRKRNQHAAREDSIRMQKETEGRDFDTCGLEIPNVLDVKNWEYLRTWNGETRFLPNITLKKFTRSQLE